MYAITKVVPSERHAASQEVLRDAPLVVVKEVEVRILVPVEDQIAYTVELLLALPANKKDPSLRTANPCT